MTLSRAVAHVANVDVVQQYLKMAPKPLPGTPARLFSLIVIVPGLPTSINKFLEYVSEQTFTQVLRMLGITWQALVQYLEQTKA